MSCYWRTLLCDWSHCAIASSRQPCPHREATRDARL